MPNRKPRQTRQSQEPLSHQELRDTAQQAVRQGKDIRVRVHDLTLQALTRRRFHRREIRDVVRAMTEGIAAGAQGGGAGMRHSLSEALSGLDQALMRSVQAGRTALKELVSSGRDLSERELNVAFDGLRRMEEDFFMTVEQVADAAGERAKPELLDALHQVRTAGTETGRQVTQLMTEFGQRVSGATLNAAFSGAESAMELGGRFAMVAGGILSGLAQALRQRQSSPRE